MNPPAIKTTRSASGRVRRLRTMRGSLPRPRRTRLVGECAVVDVREVGARHLLLVGDQTRLAVCEAGAAVRADILRGGDDDDLVEARLAPGLEEQRNLDDLDQC